MTSPRLLRRVGRSGPAARAGADRRRGLAGEAAADQLGLERGVGETLHRTLEDEPGGLGVLDIGDLVDLARRLAVAAGALVRVGDRLPGHLGELGGSCVRRSDCSAVTSARRVRIPSARVSRRVSSVLISRSSVKVAAMSARIGRRTPVPGSTSSACCRASSTRRSRDQEVGALGADLDQLALELADELLEIGGPAIQVKPQADERSAGDPDVDVPRRRGSLRGSHLTDYRRTMNRRRTRS